MPEGAKNKNYKCICVASVFFNLWHFVFSSSLFGRASKSFAFYTDTFMHKYIYIYKHCLSIVISTFCGPMSSFFLFCILPVLVLHAFNNLRLRACNSNWL